MKPKREDRAKQDEPIPLKRLGQHFLKDKNIARKIVDSLKTPPPFYCLEIGPGTGVLTELLLPKCARYVGVEVDPLLAEKLRQQFSKHPNFVLIEGDILSIPVSKFFKDAARLPRVVIGNIPYNLTSPILLSLCEASDELRESVLMVQKEVAQRMVASPHSREYGLLSIFTQLFAEVQQLFVVPPGVFYPAPRVDSAVVRLIFRKHVQEQFRDFPFFQSVLRHCFQHRRKMLRKSLSMLFDRELLRKLEVDLTRRPENLSIGEWKALVDEIIRLRQQEKFDG